MRISQPIPQEELQDVLKDKTELDRLALLRVAICEGEYIFAQQVIDYFKREREGEPLIDLFQYVLADKLLQTGEKV